MNKERTILLDSVPVDKNINNSMNSNFRCTFSNIPGCSDVETNKLYDERIRSVSLPGQSVDYYTSSYKATKTYNPISDKNGAIGDISITILTSEHYINHILIMSIIMATRNATDIHNKAANNVHSKLRDNSISVFLVEILDNSKNVIGTISYKDCQFVDVTGIDIQYGDDDFSEFTFTIKPNNIEINMFDI